MEVKGKADTQVYDKPVRPLDIWLLYVADRGAWQPNHSGNEFVSYREALGAMALDDTKCYALVHITIPGIPGDKK